MSTRLPTINPDRRENRSREHAGYAEAATIDQRPGPSRSRRVALAATYRQVAHFHWDDLIFTHLSAHAPGAEPHFLINPERMAFDEGTASSAVKVNRRVRGDTNARGKRS